MDTKKIYEHFIKYFKLLHVMLLLLCSYISFKTVNLILLIKKLTTIDYNKYINPISNYIKPEVFITILIILIVSTSVIILLKQHNKKTKLYNLMLIEYVPLAALFKATETFFNNYSVNPTSQVLLVILIGLLVLSIPQCLILLLNILRVFGVGLNKFSNVKIEKVKKEKIKESLEDKIARKNREKRYRGYFFKENKIKIRNTIFRIILVIVIIIYLNFFVINKTYNEKEKFTTNDYDITINEVYYTDKDYQGNTISNEFAFVILDVTIKNNTDTRKVALDYFHLVNKDNDYITTYNLYKTEFQDLGQTYESKILTKKQEFNQIIVFKVDKKLEIKDFKLYYQEFIYKEPHLRKINITIEDIREDKRNNNISNDQEIEDEQNDTSQPEPPKEENNNLEEPEVPKEENESNENEKIEDNKENSMPELPNNEDTQKEELCGENGCDEVSENTP